MLRLVKSGVICLGVMLLAACGGGQDRPAAKIPVAETPAPITSPADRMGAISAPEHMPIRIALLLPLSGPAEDVGRSLRDAAALALFDAYDPRLTLIPFDTKGTPEGARLAAEQAVADNISLVLGPLLADSIAAATPVLHQAGLPLIGFSNDRSIAGPSVYLMGFMPDQEVARITRYAIAQGLDRLAGLIPLSPYGDRVLQGFGPAVLDADGEIVTLVRYEPDPELLTEPVKTLARYDERRAAYLAEIKALEALGDDLSGQILEDMESQETLGNVGFDALLVAEGDPLIRSLAPLLPYYEIDPNEIRLLGTGLWDEPTLSHEPPLRGGWFPAPDPEAPRRFLKRFNEVYGRPAPRIATLAYDAMALAATLARNPVREDRFSRNAIEAPAGFSGLDGAFRFGQDGIAERHLAILEVGRTGFTVIDPAPKSFAPAKIGAWDMISPKAAP